MFNLVRGCFLMSGERDKLRKVKRFKERAKLRCIVFRRLDRIMYVKVKIVSDDKFRREEIRFSKSAENSVRNSGRDELEVDIQRGECKMK